MKPRNNPEISPVNATELMAQFKAAIQAKRQNEELEATERRLRQAFAESGDQPDQVFLQNARQYQSALANRKKTYQDYQTPRSVLLHSLSSLAGRRMIVTSIDALQPSIEVQHMNDGGYVSRGLVSSAEGLLSNDTVFASYTDDNRLYLDHPSRFNSRRYATSLFTLELEPIVDLEIY